MQSTKKPFLNNNSFDDFSRELFANLVAATKQANQFPVGEDYNFYSTYPNFQQHTQSVSQRILNLTQGFLNQGRAKTDITSIDLHVDDISQRFSNDVVDIVDEFFEEVDLFVDEAKGRRELTPRETVTQFQKKDSRYKIITGTNVVRPQDKWKEDIENSYGPFVPRIREKPNALQPLDSIFLKGQKKADKEATMAAPLAKLKQISKDMESHMAQLGITSGVTTDNELGEELLKSFPHPYRHEILSLEYQPWQLEYCPEQIYGPLEGTPFTYIDKPYQLSNLLVSLRQAKEIAIDLEAHAYRSYQGFTCLMQISTRSEDFIVDTLELRHEMYRLNEVFTNPNILKVLHGADRDVEWLQRDFSLYLVNMFDTGQASRVLEFPSASLAFLLKYFCDVNADKKYQLADWRIRPLPQEMVKYAREDTHYLLYIYDRLRNEALSRSGSANLLLSIYSRSRDISLNRYEKEIVTAKSYKKLYNSSEITLNPQQLNVFAGLYAWRDRLARQEDESVAYVLPNHMLFRIAAAMPSDVSTLLSCCSPIPPLVRLYANDLVMLIQPLREMLVQMADKDDTLDEEEEKFYQPPPLPLAPGSSLQRKFLQRFTEPASQTPTPAIKVAPASPVKTLPISSSTSVSSSTTTSTPSETSGDVKLLGLSTPPHLRAPGLGARGSSKLPSPFPVLTTEQLYHSARWDAEDIPVVLLPSELAILAKQNEDYLTHIPLPNSLFRDEADDTPERNLASSSAAAEAAKTAKAIARTLQSEMVPTKLVFDNAKTQNSDQISNGSAQSARTLQVPAGVQTTKEQSSQPDSILMSPEATDPAPKASPGSPDEIPQSMVDIYNLSNKTRRQKKRLQKQQEAKSSNEVVENVAKNSGASPIMMKVDGTGNTVVPVAIGAGSSPVKKPSQPTPQAQTQTQQQKNVQPHSLSTSQKSQSTQTSRNPQQPQLQEKSQQSNSAKDKVVIDLDADADSDTSSSVNFMKSIGWVEPNDEILRQPQQQPVQQPIQQQRPSAQGRGGRGNYGNNNFNNNRGVSRGGRGGGRGGSVRGGRGNYY